VSETLTYRDFEPIIVKGGQPLLNNFRIGVSGFTNKFVPDPSSSSGSVFNGEYAAMLLNTDRYGFVRLGGLSVRSHYPYMPRLGNWPYKKGKPRELINLRPGLRGVDVNADSSHIGKLFTPMAGSRVTLELNQEGIDSWRDALMNFYLRNTQGFTLFVWAGIIQASMSWYWGQRTPTDYFFEDSDAHFPWTRSDFLTLAQWIDQSLDKFTMAGLDGFAHGYAWAGMLALGTPVSTVEASATQNIVRPLGSRFEGQAIYNPPPMRPGRKERGDMERPIFVDGFYRGFDRFLKDHCLCSVAFNPGEVERDTHEKPIESASLWNDWSILQGLTHGYQPNDRKFISFGLKCDDVYKALSLDKVTPVDGLRGVPIEGDDGGQGTLITMIDRLRPSDTPSFTRWFEESVRLKGGV